MKKSFFLILCFISAYINGSNKTPLNLMLNDTETPIISCPENISVASNNNTSTPVNYASPSFTDNSLIGTFNVSDGQEISGFTKIGTHNNHTYYISNSSDTYQNFQSNLSSLNAAFPVTINNEAENNYIVNYLQANSIASVLIGLTDVETEGSFSWENGETVNYTNWNFNEPNNANTGEDFTQMFASGYWNDVDTSVLQMIIEVPFISEQIAGLPSGANFPVGKTTNTFRVNDGFGNIATCSFDVYVDDIIYVKANASGNNDGSSWENAFNSLQSAISTVSNGDVIWVASGTYVPSAYPASCSGCVSISDFTFELKSGVKFYGGFAGTENSLSERNITTNTTTLSGDLGGSKTNHVMLGVFNNISGATTLVDGFTIKNGEADGNSFTFITVNGFQFGLTNGGGIAIYGGGQNTITNNTFINNSAFDNGGGLFINGGNNTITNNNINNNSATHDGGGIFINGGSTNTLNNNTINNNSSFVQGGGISIIYSTNNLAKNRMFRNTSQFGGGIYFEGCNNILINNVVTGNSSAYGSGINTKQSTNVWVNNTFSENNGFYAGALRFDAGNSTLSNNIIWGNNGSYIGGSLSISHSIVEGGYPGEGNLDINPLFVNQSFGSDGDFRLQNNSPAINGGSNSSYQNVTNINPTNDFDFEGSPRLVGSNIDMGAFESSVICVPDDSSFNYSSSDYCKDASNPVPTVSGLSGGIFSSTSGLSLNNSTGEINLSASTAGTYTVTYTTISSCPNSSTVNVTINNVDNPLDFYYTPAIICENENPPTLVVFGTVNGTFSSTAGLSLNPTTGEVNISESQVGTYTITHTTLGSCPNPTTAWITIRSLPNVNFTAPSQVYLSDGIQTGLGGGTPQGVGFSSGFYSGPGVTNDGNGTTYTFDPAVAGWGIHTITYSFSDEYFCGSTASDTIEVLTCLPTYENLCIDDNINSFVLNTINNTGTGCSNPGASNYTDYSSTISTDLTQGSTYNISCTSGFFGQYFAVWIDFNQDSDFEDDDEFFEIGYAGGASSVSTPITIPTGLNPGTTRLRVMSRYSSTPLTQTDYCSQTLDYGETEDYTVVIQPGNEWTGAQDANWSNANNWSKTSIPGATDYAVIKATTNQPIINSATSVEVASLYSEPSTTLTVQGVLKVEREINNNGQITFESNTSSTGQLDEFTGTLLGSGTVEVERYIPSGKRAFRLLSPAVTTSTPIYDNWQESGLSPVGFGTHITGSSTGENGFDQSSSGNPSAFTFNNSTENQSGGASWQAVANTDVNTLSAGTPYRLFVRGDRTIDFTSTESSATATSLRATGSLHIGDYSPSISAYDANFNFLGNPYQAAVDFNQLTFSGDINTNYMFVWDAQQGDLGSFVTIDLLDGTNMVGSNANQFIQPGQSFFVRNNFTVNTAPSITFTEASKDVTEEQLSTFSTLNFTKLNLQLFSATDDGEEIVDAIGLRFSENFQNEVNDADAGKMGNTGENLALVNSNQLLSIEQRAIPIEGEEIQLFANSFQSENYSFKLQLENASEDFEVYIKDNYLETQTLIYAENVYNFNVDPSIAESTSILRFSLVFGNETLSDVDFTKENYTIYPNPTTDAIFIKGISTQTEISIYDVLGKNVLQTQIQNADEAIDLHQLEAGVYLVKVESEENNFTQKIIKK